MVSPTFILQIATNKLITEKSDAEIVSETLHISLVP